MAKNRDWMKQTPQTKWGAGHAHAWLRQGAKELSQILPAFNNGQHIVEEPGLAGNLTPGEVMMGKKDDVQLDGNQEPTRQMEREGREM